MYVKQNRARLVASRTIKLGFGNFIFHIELIARAAMYDFMGMYAYYLAIIVGYYLAIIVGHGVTLRLFAFY
ncbi:hypothetical protein AMTRI_Chr04g181370 [Amborella trichopoda]